MKTINMLTNVFCLLAITSSCDQNVNSRQEPRTESSQKESVRLKKMITKATHTDQSKYQVPDDFYVHDSACVITKNVSYKIVSLEKIAEKNNKSHSHFDLPIIVLKNNILLEKNIDIILGNDDNCPADTYDGMFVEGSHFTIQQTFCADFLFVHVYTTFKIDEKTNSIILQEYAEKYTDRSNPDRVIPSKTWTSNDFGKVLFQETNEALLKKLRQTKPK